jgi:hypothetical protein
MENFYDLSVIEFFAGVEEFHSEWNNFVFKGGVISVGQNFFI